MLLASRFEDLVQIFYCAVAWFRFGLTTYWGVYQRRSLWAVIIKIIILKRDELNAVLMFWQSKTISVVSAVKVDYGCFLLVMVVIVECFIFWWMLDKQV